MSISTQRIHFTKVGSIAHDMLGPTATSREGPILLTQLMAMTMEFVLSMPDKIMMINPKTHTNMNIVIKASNDT
jgi:hypothetical protein